MYDLIALALIFLVLIILISVSIYRSKRDGDKTGVIISSFTVAFAFLFLISGFISHMQHKNFN